MKLNFDTRSQSYGSSLAHLPSKTETLNLQGLKAWWQGLSLEEKEKVCRLEAADIVSDLVKVSNEVLLLCKLKTTFRQKDLISIKRDMNKVTGTTTQAFEFNLIDKEVLDNGLAELFSSYYLLIASKPSSDSSEPGSQPHIGVKKEKLDAILGQLINTTFHYPEGEKLFFQGKDFSTFYTTLSQKPSSLIQLQPDLPVRLRTFFERLAVFSMLLEYKIILNYYEEVSSKPQIKFLSQESRQNNINSLAMAFEREVGFLQPPMMAKTVSQLERERFLQMEALDQHSTASDSPSNPIDMSMPQSLDSEELAQKILQKCPLDGNMTVQKIFPEELNNGKSQFWSPKETPQCVDFYDGFSVGDLDIHFDPTDAMLTMSDDEEQAFPEGWKREETRSWNGSNQQHNNFSYGNSSNFQNGYKKPYNNNQRNNASYYPQSQVPFYQNQTYAPQFYPQQMNPMPMPNYSYAPQVIYNPPQNTAKPTSFSDNFQPSDYISQVSNYSNYETQHRRKDYYGPNNQRSFFYPNQGFASNNMDGYNNNNNNNMYLSQSTVPNDRQIQFGTREKPKYDKPKLPPRFQKKRENMLRN